MLLKGAYCVGEHFVDPHSALSFNASQFLLKLKGYRCVLSDTNYPNYKQMSAVCVCFIERIKLEKTRSESAVDHCVQL